MWFISDARQNKTQFRLLNMPTLTRDDYLFNLSNLSRDKLSALYAEAAYQFNKNHDPRYLEILLAVEREWKRWLEEQKKREAEACNDEGYNCPRQELKDADYSLTPPSQ